MSFMMMLVGAYIVASAICTFVVLCACVVSGRSGRNATTHRVGRSRFPAFSRFSPKTVIRHAPIAPRLAIRP